MTGLVDNGTTPSGTNTGNSTLQSQIAASLAANPNAQWGGLSDPTYWTGGSNASNPSATNSSGAGSLTTDDWQKLIAGDAGLQSVQALLAGGQAADQNALGAEVKNAYETFGKPVDLVSLASQLGMSQADIQNYLGSDAQKIAQDNTDAGLSTTARLDQANQNALRSITANLNKRGLLNSGETGYQLDQQNLGYRQAQTDAYGKFLGYLQQYQQGYLTAQQQRAASLAAAISAAADRQYGIYGNQGGGGSGGSGGGQGGSGSGGQGGDGGAPQAPNSTYGAGALLNLPGTPLDTARREAGKGVYFT